MAQRVSAISQLHLTHNINVQFTYAGVLYADCAEGRGWEGEGSPQPHTGVLSCCGLKTPKI